LAHIQLRRPLDLDEREHSHLHARKRHDCGRHDWKQALFTVFLGNVLVLIPCCSTLMPAAVRNSISSVRARFVRRLGANVPAILRALVACGWFGIQTWIGGEAINAMLVALVPSWAHFAYGPAVCFAAFWLLNVLVILRGIEPFAFCKASRRHFFCSSAWRCCSGPAARLAASPMLATPSKFQNFGDFFRFFIPSLTGVVGFLATVSLNIPDFTRYARSQRDQMIGQALGLPATMTFYSFIGIAVTSATHHFWPSPMGSGRRVVCLGNPYAVVIAMLALLMATLNVNLRPMLFLQPTIFPICRRVASASVPEA